MFVELDHGRFLHHEEVQSLALSILGVTELVTVARVQLNLRVKTTLWHLDDLGKARQHVLGKRRVQRRVIIEQTLQRRRDEQVAALARDLLLVHRVGHGAQVAQDVSGLGGAVVLGLLGHAGMARDLGEGEGIALGCHLRALQLGTGSDKAVQNAGLLDVHHVGKQADAAVIVERFGLVLVGDGTGLVALVARVVTKARHGDLWNHDLLGVAAGTGHAARRVQARGQRLALIHLIQDGRIVFDSSNRISQNSLPSGHLRALFTQSGNLAPVLQLLLAIHGSAGTRQAGLALGLGNLL